MPAKPAVEILDPLVAVRQGEVDRRDAVPATSPGHRQPAFDRIAKKAKSPIFAHDPPDIGGADVAAAVLADVDPRARGRPAGQAGSSPADRLTNGDDADEQRFHLRVRFAASAASILPSGSVFTTSPRVSQPLRAMPMPKRRNCNCAV